MKECKKCECILEVGMNGEKFLGLNSLRLGLYYLYRAREILKVKAGLRPRFFDPCMTRANQRSYKTNQIKPWSVLLSSAVEV